ncbi:S8 family serine peptidase [Ureaplasma urealyticum]|uniref:S8 family serine peptidase n=1 Tax=Ureaplasma urealyticum TaxID=2130 RepID=UPI00307F5980
MSTGNDGNYVLKLNVKTKNNGERKLSIPLKEVDNKYILNDRFNKNSIYVGSINNNYEISSYSNYGNHSSVEENIGGNLFPFLVAPGNIYGVAKINQLDKFDHVNNKETISEVLIGGTSFSTPMVTGAVSLLQAYYMANNANKTIPVSHVRSILASSSSMDKIKDISTVYKENNHNNVYGFGILNFENIIEAYKNVNDFEINKKYKEKELVKEIDLNIENDSSNLNFSLSWLYNSKENIEKSDSQLENDFNTNNYKKPIDQSHYSLVLVDSNSLKGVNYSNIDNIKNVIISKSNSNTNVELIRANSLKKGNYKILVYKNSVDQNQYEKFSYSYIVKNSKHY